MISTIFATIVTLSTNATDVAAASSPPEAINAYNYSFVDVSNGSSNGTFDNATTFNPMLPRYIRVTSMVFCIVIMCLGVVGNIMVPIVIFKTKDMRNSTNIFLVNLSVADLMVLLVCTPTVLVEVNSRPEVWVLGEEMCKAVPFVELTVAHASVLTILAISFERYYAICKPLKASYICTKARASLICLLAWFAAAIFTSPILAITQYDVIEYIDRTMVPVCFSMVDTLLPSLYFIISMLMFFFLPLFILVILYALIAKTLMDHPNLITQCKDNVLPSECVIKYRKQVVLMLGTVVLAFFICLLPFRAFTLWIIIMPADRILSFGLESFYGILYFCRIMFHINSAINPILYNVMSSKFRNGFLRICGVRYFHVVYKNRYINRRNTFNTSSSTQNTTDSFLNRYSRTPARHMHSVNRDSINSSEYHQHRAKCKQENEVYFRIPSGTSVLKKEDKKLIFNESFV